MNIDIAKQNLLDFTRAADQANLTFWIVFGTLLGFIRENNFILHDKDTDLGVWRNDPALDVCLEIAANKYCFQVEKYRKYNINIIKLTRNGEYIDIYLYNKTKDNNYMILNYSNTLINDNFTTYRVFNHDFLIPVDTKKLLSDWYDNNWLIPQRKKSYKWWETRRRKMTLNDIIQTVPGLINEPQCKKLYELAKQCNKHYFIVEIGSFQGLSTCCLGLGSLHGNKVPVVAIDLWNTTQLNDRQERFESDETYELFKSYIKAMQVDSVVQYQKSSSIEASKNWDKNNKIGILFIDGDHSYRGVYNDFFSWYDYVATNQLILFHDYSKHFPGVVKFADEMIIQKKVIRQGQVKSLLICQKP